MASKFDMIFSASFFLFFATVSAHPSVKKVEDEEFWLNKGRAALNKRLSIDPSRTNFGAKNVIIFIGDGLGIAPTVAARIYKGQQEGSPNGGEEAELLWETFPYAAFSKTYNVDHQVPDSAGTATAIFSGVKTRMAVLGIDNQVAYNTCDASGIEKRKLKSMLHKAVDDNKATGIVTTTRLTHATPGALYAHIQNREWLINNEVTQKTNVIFGGGLKNFKKKENGGKRLDGKDLVDDWEAFQQQEEHDAKVLYNSADIKNWEQSPTDFVLGLFSKSHLDFNVDRDQSDDGQPSLSEMTKAALTRLIKNPNGFFLMVEGGLIDVAHHLNNAMRALEETLELERAVKVALDMVDLDETLIIVTADHSHAMTINGYPKRGNPILGYVYNEARDIVMTQPDGYMSPYTTLSYANGPGFKYHYTGENKRPWKDVLKHFETPIHEDVEFLQPSLWGGPEGKETHGGEDVGIFAIGPMSHLFIGVQEQSYIAHVVDHATDTWKKDKSRKLNSAGMVSAFFKPTILISVLISFIF